MNTHYQAIDGFIIIILAIVALYKWFQSDGRKIKINSLNLNLEISEKKKQKLQKKLLVYKTTLQNYDQLINALNDLKNQQEIIIEESQLPVDLIQVKEVENVSESIGLSKNDIAIPEKESTSNSAIIFDKKDVVNCQSFCKKDENGNHNWENVTPITKVCKNCNQTEQIIN